MNYTPAIGSIISPSYIAALAIKNYGLNKQTTCRILKTGINHTYLLTTPEKEYVFRVYYFNWRTEVEIREELKLLEYLNKNGISVSYPIKNKEDNYILHLNAIEGKRYAVLFSYADGESIRNPSKELCFKFGETMARMHQLTVNHTIKRKNYNAEALTGWAYDLTRRHFEEPLFELDFFKKANEVISNEFKDAATKKLRYGTVHLDLWYENMKINEESKITIFDFDNCGNGHLFLDIGYSLLLLFRTEPNKENYLPKKAGFLEGYESITPISKEEKRLLPYAGLAIWLHYTGVHVQRFNDFSNQFFSKEFLKFWIQIGQQWMEFNGIKILETNSDMKTHQQELIENYVKSYNEFDVAGMLKDLHKNVVFENISNGEVNLKTEGIDAFRDQAEAAKQYFSERQQTIKSWKFEGQKVQIEIDYRGVLAVDFPNGLKSGETLEMDGVSIFTFQEGKIIGIQDRS